MLKDLEQQLIESIPKLVRAKRIARRAYGILICYPDSTSGWYEPSIFVLPESYMSQCIANRDVSCIWCLPEIEGKVDVSLSDEPFAEQCNWVGRYLIGFDGEDEVVLKPFRDMICRVCLQLNSIDWSLILYVTADFVVMASDRVGFSVEQDAIESVHPERSEALKARGIFFNPDELPEVEIPAGNLIAEMSTRPVAVQLKYWPQQLALMVQGMPSDASEAKWGEQRIISALTNLGEDGADALLAFVERFAEIPEQASVNGRARSRDDRLPGPRIVFAALGALERSLRKDDESEVRLWHLFDRVLAIHKHNEIWGRMPASIAFAIYHTFGDKYNFWIVTDPQNHISSLPEILEQRARLAPRD